MVARAVPSPMTCLSQAAQMCSPATMTKRLLKRMEAASTHHAWVARMKPRAITILLRYTMTVAANT